MMKARKLISLLSVLFLASCEPDFDYSAIPGQYIGTMYHYVPGPGGAGWEVEEYGTGEYDVNIASAGSGYVLSFDDDFVELPDVTVNVVKETDDARVEISTPDGQAFSASTVLHPNPPPSNYFSNKAALREAGIFLTLKANDPDSVYFLHFTAIRHY
jgi:hypothetical protein